MKYSELKDARLVELFTAEELLELSNLIENELKKMKSIIYEDYNINKAMIDRSRCLKCLSEDLQLMADFLFKYIDDIGLRRKNEIQND